jgi:hypothetical protein
MCSPSSIVYWPRGGGKDLGLPLPLGSLPENAMKIIGMSKEEIQ